jgi:N-acetylmuramoyl-L-alanine amidase
MKRIIFVFLLCLLLLNINVKSSLYLSGKYIIIDPGHGSKDNGTSYNNILEKDLNLSISKILEQELIKNGASTTLIREEDYDLSSPNSKRRKRSDFNNRIDFINKSNADIYLSIHINYLNNNKYSGSQVFYYGDNNKDLANTIQMYLNKINTPRGIKVMPNIYMYNKLNIKGVLIECGFISNTKDRNNLINKDYQQLLAKTITDALIDYFT